MAKSKTNGAREYPENESKKMERKPRKNPKRNLSGFSNVVPGLDAMVP